MYLPAYYDDPDVEYWDRPIAPCEPRRIEAGIFNYGSDITLSTRHYTSAAWNG